MPTKWQRLRLSQSEGLPPLLFKYTTNPKGYELYLTDLTHLWSERLNYKDILKRADEENTTIDPTEDPEQFDVLLEKIGEALHSRSGSSVTVTNGARVDSLEITLSTKLPAPLKPLKWPLYISRESQPLFAGQLLFPLLREEVDWESRQRSLLNQIKQKDWVLGKLFDKIETMGIDLSTVFPGATGLRAARKGTTLEQAAKFIKGVAPFDEQQWLKEVNKSFTDFGLAANVVSELSDLAGTTFDLEGLTPAPDKWWENLKIHSAIAATTTTSALEESPRQDKVPSKRDETATETDGGAETEDDEFERQETPPGLKHTQEESDTIQNKAKQKSPSQPLPPAPKPPAKAPKKGLGIIGKKKADKKKPTPEPEPAAAAAAAASTDSKISSPSDSKKHAPLPPSKKGNGQNQMDINMDTATESESDLDAVSIHNPASTTSIRQGKKVAQPPAAPSIPAVPVVPAIKPKKPLGMGVIGGKKKEKEKQPTPPPPAIPQTTEPETTRETTPQPHPQPKPKRPGKIGVIGGKRQMPSRVKETTTTAVPGVKVKGQEEMDAEEQGPSASISASARVKPKRENLSAEPEPEPGSKVKPEPEPPKEETEQDKIERKREELKRQLEAKSKAPVKKKRRF